MAESGKNTDGSGGGWWGNLIAVAKEQSGKVYDMVSNDLTEFTSTMQADTKHAVEKTKETLKTGTEGTEDLNATDRMKQSFHSLMSGITKALTVDPEDTSPPKQVSQPATGIFDRAKARMRAIQVDTGTYLQEPSGPQEKYADWLKSFDLDANKGEISELLVTMVEVRSLYTSLVPSEVSHQDFWRRYFYKVHQLRMDEERKKALMKRAERVDVKEDTIDWDDEESSGDEDATPSKKSPQSVKKEEQDTILQPEVAEDTKSELKRDAEQPKTDTVAQNEKRLPDETTGSESEERLKQDVEKKDVIEKTNEVQEKENKDTDAGTDKNETETEKETTPILEQTEKVLMKGFKQLTETVKTFVSGDDSEEDIDSCDKQDGTETQTAKEEPSHILEQTERVVKEGFKHITDTVKAVVSGDDTKTESPSCDKETVEVEHKTKDKELKTKVKGDMVVVGDRISPSSDSSGAKESSNDEWEHDFDVDVTPEDLAAASELAQKMNESATDYNKITGEEDDDWENWD